MKKKSPVGTCHCSNALLVNANMCKARLASSTETYLKSILQTLDSRPMKTCIITVPAGSVNCGSVVSLGCLGSAMSEGDHRTPCLGSRWVWPPHPSHPLHQGLEKSYRCLFCIMAWDMTKKNIKATRQRVVLGCNFPQNHMSMRSILPFQGLWNNMEYGTMFLQAAM